MSEKIIVIVAKDGTTTIEAEGYSGPSCDTALRELADALGTIEDVEKRPEWFGTAANVNRANA